MEEQHIVVLVREMSLLVQHGDVVVVGALLLQHALRVEGLLEEQLVVVEEGQL